MENVYVFVNESSHSTWTKLFGELGNLQEHELRRNSDFIQRKLILERSDGILNVHTPSWTRLTCAQDQVIQRTKAKVRVFSDSVVCLEKMWAHKKQLLDGKVRWKNSKCLLLTKNYWESMENQLNSIGKFSQDLRYWRFFRKSRMICENGTLKPEKFTDRITTMFNDINWTRKGNDGICISNSEKSRKTRRDSCRDIGRSSVLETKRSGMGLSAVHLKDNEISTATQVTFGRERTALPPTWLTGSVDYEWPRGIVTDPSCCGAKKLHQTTRKQTASNHSKTTTLQPH